MAILSKWKQAKSIQKHQTGSMKKHDKEAKEMGVPGGVAAARPESGRRELSSDDAPARLRSQPA